MQMDLLGKIAFVLGLISLVWGVLMSFGILPYGLLFAVTPGGAIDGAIALFLMSLAAYAWPAGAGKAASVEM
jgi:hypothetical protein